jgi:hypothetical protein
MTGLDLSTFLRLLRADVGFWLGAGAVALALAVGIWACWGRSRALRRCLVLSLALHLALVVYGGPQATRWLASGPPGGPGDESRRDRIHAIELAEGDGARPDDAEGRIGADREGRRVAEWDRPDATQLAMNEPPRLIERPEPAMAHNPPLRTEVEPLPAPEANAPEVAPPKMALPQDRQPPRESSVEPPPVEPAAPAEAAPAEAASDEPETEGPPAPAVPEPSGPDRVRGAAIARAPTPTARAPVPIGDAQPGPAGAPGLPSAPATAEEVAGRLAPAAEDATGLTTGPSPEPTEAEANSPGPLLAGPGDSAEGAPGSVGPDELAMPDVDPRRARGAGGPQSGTGGASSPRGAGMPGASTTVAMRPTRRAVGAPVSLARPAPPPGGAGGAPGLPDVVGPSGGRPLPEIPEVYRSRLAPGRSARALSDGATPESEQAVERALAWLARHQDADGRWNAGTQRGAGERPVRGDTDFTAHCPPGDRCAGECFYFDADTATTGLALLAFLGAGHTHTNTGGTYASNVSRGLDFLLAAQRPDGDLRGMNRPVGMYCHAIASLALCEAYALSGDERLRGPVERAVAFLVRARASDGRSWRYAPGDRFGGDTSILGWAVMVLKSAREVGLDVPDDVRRGALSWLGDVADGSSRGLAMYRPGAIDPRYGGRVTPSMTAEAWVCRQFLGAGGPGPASDEAAAFLLQHGPDRDPFFLYYWYYATLAMYQHGGDAWTRWNARVRDQLVRRQTRGGHADGSWDPAQCGNDYDAKGGRIYTTALAAMTLEVYYRYLRLYDAPATPVPGATDPGLRRTGLDPAERPAGPVPDR